jgi:D-glycero-D-manno-heptose 1,7-bisphosphate phosphatase
MQPALFLDRDGVIIANRQNYVRSWSDVSIYPQAIDGLAKISSSNFKVILITNQSVVGRGFISQGAAVGINERLVLEIQNSGGRIDDVYMCPHAPQDICICRKPEPGLILEAASKHAIELPKSILIGDALSDIIAGQRAGIQENILVRTGRGSLQSSLPLASQIPDFRIFETLYEALEDCFPAFFKKA